MFSLSKAGMLDFQSLCGAGEESRSGSRLSWNLSKSGTTSALSPNQQRVWPGAGTSIFLKSSPVSSSAATGDDQSVEADPDPQFEPIVALPSIVEVGFL